MIEIDNNLLNNEEYNILLNKLQNRENIEKCSFSTNISDNYELLQKLGEKYPDVLLIASQALKNDIKFITPFLKKRPSLILSLPEQKNNKNLADFIVTANSSLYNFFDEEVRETIHICISALVNKSNYKHIPKSCFSNSYIMSDIESELMQNPKSFLYFSDEMQTDIKFINKAVECNGEVLKYVQPKFYTDDLLINAIDNNSDAIDLLETDYFDTKKVLYASSSIIKQFKNYSENLDKYYHILLKFEHEDSLLKDISQKDKILNNNKAKRKI